MAGSNVAGSNGPDLGQFGEAWFLSAVVAAALVAATAFILRRVRPAIRASEARPWVRPAAGWTALTAVVGGATAGFWWLGFSPRLPPAGGLDRLLTIVLPAAATIEALAALPQLGRKFIWLFRAMVAAGLTPVLLWGSGYVSGRRPVWSAGETAGVYVGIGAAVFGIWLLLAIGNRRTTGVAAAATTLALQAAGIVMFYALYLGGGKASLPLAGALVGATLLGLAYADPAARSARGETLSSLALIGLAGLVIVGRFFSRVTTGEAAVLLAAPLLTLVGELPMVTKRRPWVVATVKLALAAVPPAIVAYLAKRAFEQDSDLLM